MNYLRMISVPILVGLLAAMLSSCPKKPDETNIDISTNDTPPTTTIVENTQTPPADTDINITVDTDPNTPVIVTEETRTKYPEVVTVVERHVAAPADTTVYIADAPAIKVWTEKIVIADAPADVVYRVRDLNVLSATDTDITAEGYVLVASPAPEFKSERKYVTYTFRKDPTTSQWLVYDLAVSRTEPATAEDLGTPPTAGGSSGSSGAGY